MAARTWSTCRASPASRACRMLRCASRSTSTRPPSVRPGASRSCPPSCWPPQPLRAAPSKARRSSSCSAPCRSRQRRRTSWTGSRTWSTRSGSARGPRSRRRGCCRDGLAPPRHRPAKPRHPESPCTRKVWWGSVTFAATLQRLRARGNTRCVLGLRDVLYDQETVRRTWAARANMDAIRDYYDTVWIYGDPAVFDPVREYDLAEHVAAKARYTGYLDQRPRLDLAGP